MNGEDHTCYQELMGPTPHVSSSRTCGPRASSDNRLKCTSYRSCGIPPPLCSPGGNPPRWSSEELPPRGSRSLRRPSPAAPRCCSRRRVVSSCQESRSRGGGGGHPSVPSRPLWWKKGSSSASAIPRPHSSKPCSGSRGEAAPHLLGNCRHRSFL